MPKFVSHRSSDIHIAVISIGDGDLHLWPVRESGQPPCICGWAVDDSIQGNNMQLAAWRILKTSPVV